MNESIIKKIFKKLVKLLVSKMRKMTNCVYRFRLKNNDFTLIASNCNGTFLLYDLKLKYNTPTVDLWIPPTDFIRFCSNLPYYLNVELSFVYEDGVIHPIGLLDDVKVYFTHYNSCTEAKKKWDERKKELIMIISFF